MKKSLYAQFKDSPIEGIEVCDSVMEGYIYFQWWGNPGGSGVSPYFNNKKDCLDWIVSFRMGLHPSRMEVVNIDNEIKKQYIRDMWTKLKDRNPKKFHRRLEALMMAWPRSLIKEVVDELEIPLKTKGLF